MPAPGRSPGRRKETIMESKSFSRRALFAKAILPWAAARTALAQNPFGQPGISCSPPDGWGNQVCTTGIPTHEIQMVYAPQRQSQWCWAACLEMIFRYHGLPISQEQIVTETFGAQINLPAQKPVILSNVNRPWMAGGRRVMVRSDFMTVTPDVAAWELMAKRPLIVGTMGHAMVLTAMTYRRAANGSGQPFQLTVRDPWPGRGRRDLSLQEIFGINEAVGGICYRIQMS
jgi:hypothetical protein